MPELDPDLVNLLTLALLGLIVICLLGVMATIGRVHKAIDRAAAQQERQREDRWESSRSPAVASDAETAEPEPAIERRPEPASARESEPATQSQESAAYEPAASSAAASDGPGVVATQSTSAAGSGAMSASEPAAASSSGASTSTESAQEPQEQPFERDGRWWFRRGSELLVYDEGTGQWIAAPDDQSRAGPASQPIPAAMSNISASSEVGSESSAEGEQHGFWKCPSCGAVNGSTATSCRMCFTARP